jgi:hypothetical protein
MRSHPLDGELRTLLDGAAGRWRAVRLRIHLLRCRACRARLEEEARASARVEMLLGRLTPEVAVADGWERVVARSRAPVRARGASLPPFLAGGLVGATACAAVLFALRGGAAPIEAPSSSVSQPGVALMDRCCSDLDGDGVANDGQITLHREGRTHLMLVYSDLDGSGDLSAGDVIRSISTAPVR